MSRFSRPRCRHGLLVFFLIPVCAAVGLDSTARGGVSSEEVERAIREGVRFLKQRQRPDGSWLDVDKRYKTGTTSLVTLALLTAGEKPDSQPIRAALEYLRRFGPEQLRFTYTVGLQTMVFAAADPERDRMRILANVDWL